MEPIRKAIIAKLKTIYDPEIPINIYDLGLIYHIDVTPTGMVTIQMTLTSPACPVAGILPKQIEDSINRIPEVVKTKVELVWDPPWNKDKMTQEAKLELNLL